MYRGVTTFTCGECNNKFRGPDFEFMATIFTTPQPCPRCGSKHTYPRNLFSLNRSLHKKIWETIDK